MPGELEWAIIVGNSILQRISGALFVLAIRKARRGSACRLGVLLNGVFHLLGRLSGTARREH